jgi:hypothetical protein
MIVALRLILATAVGYLVSALMVAVLEGRAHGDEPTLQQHGDRLLHLEDRADIAFSPTGPR